MTNGSKIGWIIGWIIGWNLGWFVVGPKLNEKLFK